MRFRLHVGVIHRVGVGSEGADGAVAEPAGGGVLLDVALDDEQSCGLADDLGAPGDGALDGVPGLPGVVLEEAADALHDGGGPERPVGAGGGSGGGSGGQFDEARVRVRDGDLDGLGAALAVPVAVLGDDGDEEPVAVDGGWLGGVDAVAGAVDGGLLALGADGVEGGVLVVLGDVVDDEDGGAAAGEVLGAGGEPAGDVVAQ